MRAKLGLDLTHTLVLYLDLKIRLSALSLIFPIQKRFVRIVSKRSISSTQIFGAGELNAICWRSLLYEATFRGTAFGVKS